MVNSCAHTDNTDPARSEKRLPSHHITWAARSRAANSLDDPYFKFGWFPLVLETSKKLFSEEFQMKIDFQMNMWFVESRNFGMCWARWTKYIKEIESRRRRRRRKKTEKISFFSAYQKLCVVHYSWRQDNESPQRRGGISSTENTGWMLLVFFSSFWLKKYFHFCITTGHFHIYI